MESMGPLPCWVGWAKSIEVVHTETFYPHGTALLGARLHHISALGDAVIPFLRVCKLYSSFLKRQTHSSASLLCFAFSNSAHNSNNAVLQVFLCTSSSPFLCFWCIPVTTAPLPDLADVLQLTLTLSLHFQWFPVDKHTKNYESSFHFFPPCGQDLKLHLQYLYVSRLKKHWLGKRHINNGTVSHPWPLAPSVWTTAHCRFLSACLY